MKRLFVLVLALVLAAFYAGTLTVRAENQPHMKAALEHLQAAKGELEKAEADKGGFFASSRVYNDLAMKIAIGADHAGFELKEKIKQRLAQQGINIQDEGTVSNESVDYPDFARKVGEDVAAHKVDLGVLVCGSGIGMSIAANKVPGIRAAPVTTVHEAQMSREHNDANVLTLGARILSEDLALKIVDRWLHTPFAGGRHQRRVDKISAIENERVTST